MAIQKRPRHRAEVTGMTVLMVGELYKLAETHGAIVENCAHEVSETNGATRTRIAALTRYPDKVLMLPGRSSPVGKRALEVHQHLVKAVARRNGDPWNRRDFNAYLDAKGVKASTYSPAISIMIREGSIKIVEPKQPKTTAKTRVRGDQPNK